MVDPRMTKLAHNLINMSCRLQKGEKVLIENNGIEPAFVAELVKEAYKAGALPFVWLKDEKVTRQLYMGVTEEQLRIWAENEAQLMAQMDAYIGVRASANSTETADVPEKNNADISRLLWQPVHGLIRVPKTRWVVLRYPTPSMAQMAGMSTEAFEDYYFDVCCLDYEKMSRAMDALVERMERADRVRLTARGTDLTFSIRGMKAIKCAGECNIPDGEVYTAPVKESVNGVISYNTPSLEDGVTFENIRLVFKDGRIVEASSSDTARMNAIFDTDEGARYVGEFAIGVNPFITFPMKDTLFDEKICGSFHFTPGSCYEDCENGNHSAVHWDLVCIQTPEYGGGEMWFDDELIRRDGRFVPEYLSALNPENLK